MEQSQKRQDIVKACKLYYDGGMYQEEIGGMMHISRPEVSRLLSEGRKYNIVQITVNDPVNTCGELSRQIRERYHLGYVKVAPSGNSEESAKNNVGQVASEFLNERIREHSRIGISWGTTLSVFVRTFQSQTPFPGARIVQMVGGSYNENLNIDGRELVKILAKKLRCSHSILQAPLYVHNTALRDLLMQEPDVIHHFRYVQALDMAFVGIGNASKENSIAFRGNYIAEQEAIRLSEQGFVCDICGHQLLADGSEPSNFLSDRVVGVSLEQLHRIPIVVGLCTGHKKAIPLRAALRGGHINALILDEICAIALLALDGEETPGYEGQKQ